MAGIERFEDTVAWQKARELANLVYELTKRRPFSNDFAPRDQLRRASVSIMLNIAEGFGRQTRKEFLQFLVVARGSAVELESGAYLASDQGYLSEEEFQHLYDRAKVVEKLITALAGSLRREGDASGA